MIGTPRISGRFIDSALTVFWQYTQTDMPENRVSREDSSRTKTLLRFIRLDMYHLSDNVLINNKMEYLSINDMF